MDPIAPPPAFQELKARLAKIHDLDKAKALLEWDARTMMPPGGAATRSEQIASIERSKHERFTDDEIGRLIDATRAYEESLPADADDAALVRIARHEWEKARRVPAGLAAQLALAGATAERTWLEARERNDFSILLPQLREIVDLKLRYIDCFAPLDDPYDALLDDFEPEVTTAEIAPQLEELRSRLTPLAAAIAEQGDPVDDSCLRGRFPADAQEELCCRIAAQLPLERGTWRLDPTVHPFATILALKDLRITTRYDQGDFTSAILSMLHELGHALYDTGVEPALDRTPVGQTVSLSLHESQSRLWENQVGRSRAFWHHFFPLVREKFPAQFRGVGPETVYRAVNRVTPSLIRIEADEVTYNLHIILRFELEHELFNGRLELRDLPEVWNARTKEYLGIDVPDDAHGVLQDVHWSEGAFGYFPTYAIGNLISGRLWAAVHTALPDLDGLMERGQFGPLREWLREHVHRHGRKLGPNEVVERATGGPIEVGPYVAYLEAKAEEIYGIRGASAARES